MPVAGESYRRRQKTVVAGKTLARRAMVRLAGIAGEGYGGFALLCGEADSSSEVERTGCNPRHLAVAAAGASAVPVRAPTCR